jgi:hypothetical protein
LPKKLGVYGVYRFTTGTNIYSSIYSNLGGTLAEFTLNLTATCFACYELPRGGLKLVKSGEGSRPRPGTPAKRAQHASHVVVLVLIPIYLFTDLRLYRVGKFLKKLGAFYKKKCVVFV